MTDIEPRRFRLSVFFGALAFFALVLDLITGAQYVALLGGMMGFQ